MPFPTYPPHQAARILFLLGCTTGLCGAVTWDNSAGTGTWSEPTNWDTNAEPDSSSAVIFPSGAGISTITLGPGEQAQSLEFNRNYTLAGGALALSGSGSIQTSSFTTAVIATPLDCGGGLTKTGVGTLVLQAANTNTSGTAIHEGTLQLKHASAPGSGTLFLGATSGSSDATLSFNGNLSFANPLVVRPGSSGAATLEVPGSSTITWDGTIELQRNLTLSRTGSPPAILNGVISGNGKLLKTEPGEFVLANASNSFGDGSADALTIRDGTLTVSSDAALGHPGNGITFADRWFEGHLKIDGSFATSRRITFNNSPDGNWKSVMVTEGHEFTLNSPLAGSGPFGKSGPGIMILPPELDSNPRGTGTTSVGEGILRVQAPQNLGTANPVVIGGGTLELCRDQDTDWGYLVSGSTGRLHVAPSPGSSAMNGRHHLPSLHSNGSQLRITGANGYGLRIDSMSGDGSPAVPDIRNETGQPLLIGNLNAANYFKLGGSADVEVTGALNGGGGSLGSFMKVGTGALLARNGISNFSGLRVYDGTLDLNGVAASISTLDFGGSSESSAAARLLAGSGGGITLGSSITYNPSSTSGPVTYTGPLALTAAAHTFDISDSTPAATLTELNLDGPITGAADATINKTNRGTLRFSGAGNTLPGLTTVSLGTLELNKSSGDGIGSGGLSVTGTAHPGTNVLLLAGEQISDTASVALSGPYRAELDLNGFTETVGNVTLAQSGSQDDQSILKTGATGTLVLKGDLSFDNDVTDNSVTSDRAVLLTGSGERYRVAYDGTLDLGGGTRTVLVTGSSGLGSTIETRVINGSIIKTGPHTLVLGNPQNSISSLQINQGTVRGGGGTTLGSGPITFGGTGGTTAGLHLATPTGTFTNELGIGSGGDVTLIYDGAIPKTQVLSGNVTAQKSFTVEVTNGSTGKDRTATLHLSGLISDGSSSFGITKTGEGTLRLAAGQAYSGSMRIRRGTLRVADPSELGDGSGPIYIDGGCLMGTAPFTISRPLNILGGSLRSEAAGAIEFSGNVTWSANSTASFGNGTSILSGSTTSGSARLSLGSPTAYAAATSVEDELGSGHVLSLRGTTALPTGNLSFDRGAVLELGNSDFTRALGTASGQFQMPATIGAGWAAYGADRTVNVGGASAALTWGQASPAFLNKANVVSALVLGSPTATGKLSFMNPLALNNGQTGAQTRRINTRNGPATVEARIAGNLTWDDPTRAVTLALGTEGKLELAGNVLGRVALMQDQTGITEISGDNDFTEAMSLQKGTWVFTNAAALGAPASITVAQQAHFDAGALEVTAGGKITLDGTLTGKLQAPAEFTGRGKVIGDLTVESTGLCKPVANAMPLEVTGHFTMLAGSSYQPVFTGSVAGTGHSQLRVGGTVNLQGATLGIAGAPAAAWILLGQRYHLLLNDGDDPITGSFAGLPEGALLPVNETLALRVTYRANGDGGTVGNDFALDVVDPRISDRTLSLDGPVAVGFGEEIVLTYTLGNAGPGPVTGAGFEGIVPVDASFLGSTPAGTLNQQTLTIPLADLPSGASATVVMRFQAGNQPGALLSGGRFTGTSTDPDGSDPSVNRAVAYLPGGQLVLSGVSHDRSGNHLDLSVESIVGVRYRVEGSDDLKEWSTLEEFTGTGGVITRAMPVDAEKEFFRIRVVP